MKASALERAPRARPVSEIGSLGNAICRRRRLRGPWVFALLLSGLVGAQPTAQPGHASPTGGTRRALLVAIDKYIPGPTTPAQVQADTPIAPRRQRGKVGDLEGTNNDVDAMRDVLITRFGFAPANIHVLRDAQATRDRILGEIRGWLVTTPAPGDISLFYYAGHGSQVFNSKSTEPDKMDETIVPSDANLDRPDIRDKELARLFDEAIDRRVVVTAIFDSCHSGSIARGLTKPTRVRSVEPDLRDVADPSAPVAPETRGALVVSAAQDLQTAGEVEVQEEGNTHHGLFTWALVKTLRNMPVNQSVERTFLSVRGLMQTGERLQEPVLAGTDARKKGALFGAADASAGTVLAVQEVRPDGSVVLQGGLAAGVRRGAELRPLNANAGTALTLRIVEEQGLSLSRAEAVEGNASGLAPGALFRVTKWAASPGVALRVWVRPSQMTARQVTDEAHRLAALTSDARIPWTNEPTASAGPLSMIQRADEGWQFLGPDGSSTTMGSGAPTAEMVLARLPSSSRDAHVVIDLPLPLEASRLLWQGTAAESGLIEPQRTIDHADYILVGRVRNGAAEYAWVRPLVTDAEAKTSPLPASTTWFPLGSDPEALAGRLRDSAVRLGVVLNWLQLESPADPGKFPYHLAMKHLTTGEIRTEGVATASVTTSEYGLVLTLDEAMQPASIDRRYVYAFAVSDDGSSKLIFPEPTTGNVENLLPLKVDNTGKLPKGIRIGPALDLTPGVDTFILLTTATALADPTVLQGKAVRESGTRGPSDPLSALLAQGGAARRGVTITTPADWSIERFTIRTVTTSGKSARKPTR